jgi:hypothetical protein
VASSYSLRFRLNYQAPGDNLNLWGTVLNVGVFQLLEDAISKRVAFTLSGSKTLTTADGAADEARCAFLHVTGGTGGTIITPEIEKWYMVRNAASGAVVLDTDSGGDTVSVAAGETCLAVCDGTNWTKVTATSFGGAALTDLADPATAQGAATKAYVDAIAWAVNAGILPGQTGAGGKFLTTNGTTPSWAYPTVASISDYVSDQTARAVTARKSELFMSKHF